MGPDRKNVLHKDFQFKFNNSFRGNGIKMEVYNSLLSKKMKPTRNK